MPLASINKGSLRLRIGRKCCRQFNYRAVPSYFAVIPFNSAHGCWIKWTHEQARSSVSLYKTLCSKASGSLTENKHSCWRCFCHHSPAGDPRKTGSASCSLHPSQPASSPCSPPCHAATSDIHDTFQHMAVLGLPFHLVQCNKILWAQHFLLGVCYCIPS